MAHFPAALDRGESDALVVRIEAHFERHGFGLWAIERLADRRLLGFTGLGVPGFEAPFMPAVEVGWRLAADAWGQGYASEAAVAALDDGFERLGLAEIVSFTARENERSRRLMARLGLFYDPADDFLHPALPATHRLAAHVLYRLPRERWHELAIPRPRASDTCGERQDRP